MEKCFGKILYFFDNIERYVGIFALTVMLVVIFYQVLLRYVFNNANSWSEELARYMHILLVYMSCGYATRMREHIKIDMLINILPKYFRPLAVRFGELLFLAFCLVIIYFGVKQSISVLTMGRISSALKLPMGIVYLLLPVGYTFTSIRIVQNWVLDLAVFARKCDSEKGGRT
jgi:TRAP-type C4-dicarboxylate transport system permease small subunit